MLSSDLFLSLLCIHYRFSLWLPWTCKSLAKSPGKEKKKKEGKITSQNTLPSFLRISFTYYVPEFITTWQVSCVKNAWHRRLDTAIVSRPACKVSWYLQPWFLPLLLIRMAHYAGSVCSSNVSYIEHQLFFFLASLEFCYVPVGSFLCA